MEVATGSLQLPKPRARRRTAAGRLISPKIGGDIAEDGAKERKRRANKSLRYELQRCCSSGCVCVCGGGRGDAGIVLGRCSSQFWTQCEAIKCFILLATFNRKDRETARRRGGKVGRDNSVECESGAIICNEGEEIKLQRRVVRFFFLPESAGRMWTD